MALPKNDINTALSVDGLLLRTKPDGTIIGGVGRTPAPTPTGGGLLKIETTIDDEESTMRLDKTWTEINAAWEAGILPILDSQGIGHFEGAYDESEAYTVYFFIPGTGIIQFGCSDADDYPTYISTNGGGGDNDNPGGNTPDAT